MVGWRHFAICWGTLRLLRRWGGGGLSRVDINGSGGATGCVEEVSECCVWCVYCGELECSCFGGVYCVYGILACWEGADGVGCVS